MPKTEVLLVWACLAAVAVLADMWLLRRRLTGRMGEQARADTRAAALRAGGIPTMVVVSLCLDVLVPPASLAACLAVGIRAAARGRAAGPAGHRGDPRAGGSQAAGSRPGGRDGGPDPLARLLDRLGQAYTRPWQVTAAELALYGTAAAAGCWLRLLTGLPAGAAAGAGAAVALTGLVPMRGRGRRAGRQVPAPGWAAAARAAEQALPAGLLAPERRSLADFAARTGRRGAFLYLYADEDRARYRGLRHAAVIYEESGYLLAVLGDRIQPVAAAVLGHELAHRSGWPQRLARTAMAARLAGWLLAGWAAGWPWLLAAGAAIQAVTMLALWAVEAGCDLSAARQHGAAALITAVQFGATLPEPMPGPERRLLCGLRHLTGLTRHPPVTIRCLILRALTPTAPPQRHVPPDEQPAASDDRTRT